MPRLRLPHPLVLLLGGVLAAALLTWILPAGEFTRRDDPVTGRSIVVAGTYHPVPAAPVGPIDAAVAVPQGIAAAVGVVAMVFLAGAAFTVVDRTGALRRGVDWLADRLAGRAALVVPISCLLFATFGALQNMQEEIIALVPVLLLLVRRLGFDPLTAAAMSSGAAAVGAAFSPINPFQVGIAQQLAGLPLLSGAPLRLTALAAALAVWTWGTLRHARAAADGATEVAVPPPAPAGAPAGAPAARAGTRDALVLAVVLGGFAVFIVGVLRLGWDFDRMSGLFLTMGLAAGLVGGLGLDGTARAMVAGFQDMAFSAILIGIARAISVVLEHGRVIDTIVDGLFAPLAHLPVAAAAAAMVALHTLVHVVVPSVSGQAVLTMPVLVPLSDLLGMARQVTVLAYQVGAGLCELVTPTNGALVAVLAACGVRFERWLRFALPLWGALVAVGLIAVAAALALGVG